MGKIILEEQAAANTPAANKVAVYPKAGGGVYKKDDVGTETQLIESDDFDTHASQHENAGSDEISVAGLSGLLADDQHVLDSEVQAVSINNVAEDATPQLGGDLDCNSHAITSPTDPTDEHGVGDRGYYSGLIANNGVECIAYT